MKNPLKSSFCSTGILPVMNFTSPHFWFLLLCLCLQFMVAHAAVPSRITYQGRLSKSGVGAAGRHTITVRFVDAEGKNIPYSQTFDVDVPTSGDFSLEIEFIPPDAEWINGLPKMRVIIDGEALTPDQAFSASPYALVARNVENMDTSKVKLAGSKTEALLSSWQSPDNPNGINAAVIIGTITTTTDHGSQHALGGKDPIPANALSPAQIKDTAMVLTSSFTQTIEPTQPVVPLVVKGQRNTGSTLNMFEVWDNSAVPSEQFHIQGSGNAYFKGNVGIGTETPTQKLHINGDDQMSLYASQTGHHDYGTVLALQTTGDGAQNGPRLSFLKTNSKSWSMGIPTGEGSKNFSIWEDGWSDAWGTERFTIAPGGNIGIGRNADEDYKLLVDGGDHVGLRVHQKGNHDSGLVAWLSTSGDGSQAGPRLGFYKGDVKAWTMGIQPGLGNINFTIQENCLGDCTGKKELFTIADGGNVSIGGAPSSVAKLKVAGTDDNPVAFLAGATNLLEISPKGSSVDIGATNVARTNSAPLSIRGSSIALKTDSGQPLTVTSDGKVGVNTPTPTKTLDVVGDANITGKITGATFGFGGFFSVMEGGGGTVNVNQFKNPMTNDYSCPTGFTSNRILYARTGDGDHGAWLYICTK